MRVFGTLRGRETSTTDILVKSTIMAYGYNNNNNNSVYFTLLDRIKILI